MVQSFHFFLLLATLLPFVFGQYQFVTGAAFSTGAIPADVALGAALGEVDSSLIDHVDPEDLAAFDDCHKIRGDSGIARVNAFDGSGVATDKEEK